MDNLETLKSIAIVVGVICYLAYLIRKALRVDRGNDSLVDPEDMRKYLNSQAQKEMDKAIRNDDMKALWEIVERTRKRNLDIHVPPILQHIVRGDTSGKYAEKARELLNEYE
jgi:hypothetical protein